LPMVDVGLDHAHDLFMVEEPFLAESVLYA